MCRATASLAPTLVVLCRVVGLASMPASLLRVVPTGSNYGLVNQRGLFLVKLSGPAEAFVRQRISTCLASLAAGLSPAPTAGLAVLHAPLVELFDGTLELQSSAAQRSKLAGQMSVRHVVATKER